jgi:hypothetical protein
MKRPLVTIAALFLLAGASPTSAHQTSTSNADAPHVHLDVTAAAVPAAASSVQAQPSTAGAGPTLIVQPASPARRAPTGMEIPIIGFAVSGLLYLLAKL